MRGPLRPPTRRSVLFAGAVLLWPRPGSSEDNDPRLPGGLQARILRRGPARAGGDFPVRIEVSWPGRPERLVPQVPALTVPEGAATRLGTTGSTFEGDRTTWWTEVVVTLPDLPGPWSIGPAELEIIDPARGGARLPLEIPARRFRESRRRNLLGQGLGSALVLTAAGAWGLHLWRRLGEDEGSRPSPLPELVRVAEGAVSGPVEPFVEALIALRGALPEAAASVPDLPAAESLDALRDGVRFGGQTLPAARRRTLLAPLAAAARAAAGEEPDV